MKGLSPVHATKTNLYISFTAAGRTTLNHSTNDVVVDSAGKKQTRVWNILKVWPNLFLMNHVFYNKNERL